MKEGSAILTLPVPTQARSSVPFLNAIGGDVSSASFPDLPSLLRSENRRFLMNRIDTTTIPDFSALIDIGFDHDIYVATQMIAFDTITGWKIGGRNYDSSDIDTLVRLDETVDMSELFRAVTYDELRFGNGIIWNRHEEDGSGKRRMVDCRLLHPGKIVDMRQSTDTNKPMWWVFKEETITGEQGGYVAFTDPTYMKEFEMSGYGGSRVVGEASDIVHFKGSAPAYQTWGIGITQVAKILIEAKLDMLVDFSKIIKREASPKEYVYVNTTGLSEDNRRAKITQTIKEVNKQRKLGSVIVMEMNESEAKIIGSEGKVLDNFSLHYRDDILRAIRILTRIPPSFWLGEATNKATINSQLIVYNRYLNSIRWFSNKRFRREIFLPYIKSNFDPNIRLGSVPEIVFNYVAIEDATDRAMMDDMAVRNYTKSRKQVARENGYTLPEEDGEDVQPFDNKSSMAEIVKEERMKESMGVAEK